MQRPSQPPGRATHRTPRPLDAVEYEGILFHRLAEFFATYAMDPRPETVEEAFAIIEQLRLLQRTDHRHGIAGSIEGLGRWHMDQVPTWRVRWAKLYEVVDKLRPSEMDNEITIASQLDYLLMLGIVSDDELPIARMIRLGMRRDSVGDAAVLLLDAHKTVPVILRTMAAAVATTTTGTERTIPQESIKQLTMLAISDPMWYASILYVGWQPRGRTQSGPTPSALVITTPDGCLPARFPKQWDGHPIEARKATMEEVDAWRRIQASKDAP